MNNSSTVCVDASIVLRHILQPDNEAVKELWGSWIFRQCQLISPALLFYEVTNGLYQQQKFGLLSAETIRDSLELAISLPIKLVGEIGLHQRARELATKYKLPVFFTS
jgi:predicted nucleic acid-binding protein